MKTSTNGKLASSRIHVKTSKASIPLDDENQTAIMRAATIISESIGKDVDEVTGALVRESLRVASALFNTEPFIEWSNDDDGLFVSLRTDADGRVFLAVHAPAHWMNPTSIVQVPYRKAFGMVAKTLSDFEHSSRDPEALGAFLRRAEAFLPQDEVAQ